MGSSSNHHAESSPAGLYHFPSEIFLFLQQGEVQSPRKLLRCQGQKGLCTLASLVLPKQNNRWNQIKKLSKHADHKNTEFKSSLMLVRQCSMFPHALTISSKWPSLFVRLNAFCHSFVPKTSLEQNHTPAYILFTVNNQLFHKNTFSTLYCFQPP